jgi:predicted nucleic acid-binding protein
MLFADASALIKRYVREPHSTTTRRRLAAGPVAVSRLSEVEVPSGLARLCREGRLTERARDRALAAVAADFAAWYIVELSHDVTAIARRCLTRHHLRSGDAIQLASALWLQQALDESLGGFLAFDDRLVVAARNEPLVVIGAT